MTPRLLSYGPGGWLVEVDERDVVGFAAAIRARGDPAVAEVVPAARTVLVRVRDDASLDDVADWLAPLVPSPDGGLGAGGLVEIAVTYDGADLDAVAAAAGLDVAAVVERHSAPTYRSAFCGFAPGFAYLVGLDERLVLPRRATPRTRVPAGSVAIAAAYSAVYPSPSPGGWHLLGRTEVELFDPTRSPPALLPPGTSVRFVAR